MYSPLRLADSPNPADDVRYDARAADIEKGRAVAVGANLSPAVACFRRHGDGKGDPAAAFPRPSQQAYAYLYDSLEDCRHYNSTASLSFHGGSSIPRPNNCLGLDRSHTNALGQLLGMMTVDLPYTDRRMARHTQKLAGTGRAMGGKSIPVGWPDDRYSIVP